MCGTLGGYVILLALAVAIRGEMEGFAANTEKLASPPSAKTNCPHCALLRISCMIPDYNRPRFRVHENWACTSAILNQKLLLTNAQCFYSCNNGATITINLGSVTENKGVLRSGHRYFFHDEYDYKTISNDIALVATSSGRIPFSSKITRVALMKKPPSFEKGSLAGWGTVVTRRDIVYVHHSPKEKRVWQLWNSKTCLATFNFMPRGSICGSTPKESNGYDPIVMSGAPLVARGFILTGMLSYDAPNRGPNNLMIFTDPGYHYDWIYRHAKDFYCHH